MRNLGPELALVASSVAGLPVVNLSIYLLYFVTTNLLLVIYACVGVRGVERASYAGSLDVCMSQNVPPTGLQVFHPQLVLRYLLLHLPSSSSIYAFNYPLSICPSIHLSNIFPLSHPSIYPLIHPTIHPFIVCLHSSSYICPLVCLTTFLLSILPSILSSIHPWSIFPALHPSVYSYSQHLSSFLSSYPTSYLPVSYPPT